MGALVVAASSSGALAVPHATAVAERRSDRITPRALYDVRVPAEKPCPECYNEPGVCVWCHGTTNKLEQDGVDITVCSHCGRTGKCPFCNGSGYVTEPGKPSR